MKTKRKTDSAPKLGVVAGSAMVGREFRNRVTQGTMRVISCDGSALVVVHFHPRRGWNNTKRRQSWATFRSLYVTRQNAEIRHANPKN